MSLHPTIGLFYGVRIAAADVGRVRALCDAGALPDCGVWDGGEAPQPYAVVGATASWRPLLDGGGALADGLPLDVEALPHDLGGIDDVPNGRAMRRIVFAIGGPSLGWPRWWIVGRVSRAAADRATLPA